MSNDVKALLSASDIYERKCRQQSFTKYCAPTFTVLLTVLRGYLRHLFTINRYKNYKIGQD